VQRVLTAATVGRWRDPAGIRFPSPTVGGASQHFAQRRNPARVEAPSALTAANIEAYVPFHRSTVAYLNRLPGTKFSGKVAPGRTEAELPAIASTSRDDHSRRTRCPSTASPA
jgi:hypothetical protein